MTSSLEHRRRRRDVRLAGILNGDACHSLQTVTYTGFQFVYTCATGTLCIDNCPTQTPDAGT